jgi:hypothetical protein
MMDLHAMGHALARKTDPETSHEAAGGIKVAPLEAVVLEALKAAPAGYTADELAIKLPTIPMNTLTPRFASLMRKGLIRDTGERRQGRSGRSQRVLCVE